MIDLSKLTVLVLDQGEFVDFAARLARDFGKVYYRPTWEAEFPVMNQGRLGEGIEGLEVVSSEWEIPLEEIDVFIFPDVYHGFLQNHLLDMGKLVFGSRLGEDLELYRDDTKKLLKKWGLPVAPYTVLKDMESLREYLKEHKDVFVKISRYRGTFETFKSKNYRNVEPKLDEIEHELGPFKYKTDFLVEDNLPDRLEIGIDGYCVDGEFPAQTLIGIEVKDACYIGRFMAFEDIPEPLRRFNRVAGPTLKRFGYRGACSSEVRIGKDQEPYMVDFCARLGCPPSNLYQEFYTNISEIVYETAKGNLLSPVPAGKYGAEIRLISSWAEKNPQAVSFPEKNRQFIKLQNCVKIKGSYYVLPQHVGVPEIGSAIGWGETPDEAIGMAQKMAESVEGYQIEIPKGALEKAQEEMDRCSKLGYKIFKE